MPPLEAVDGAQVADFAVGKTDAVEKLAGAVTVPYFDAGGRERERGSAAGDEPKQLGDHGA